MINQDLPLPSLIDTSGVDLEERAVEYWQKAYLKLKQENIELETKLSAAEKESAQLPILDFRFWIGDELVGIEGWFSSDPFTI